MLLDAPGRKLREAEIRPPELRPGEVRIRVAACGVCRTDLHIRDGELAGAKLPLVLGHQVVGTVVEGDDPAAGARVGVPWLGWTCGACRCRTGRENLCDRARFTGYTLDGGYAEEVVADRRCCRSPAALRTPSSRLLCAGLIGYRALRAAGDGERLGLYGFGAAAHIVAQLARHEGRRCSPSPARATRPRSRWRASSAPCGRARSESGRRSSTPRSSSRRRASSCRRRWPSARAARSFARVST